MSDDVVITLENMNEEQLLAELSRLKSIIWEASTEEESRIEEEMNIIRKRIKVVRTIRHAKEDIAKQEEEERQIEIEKEKEKKRKEEEEKKRKEDRIGELDKKYLEAARLRYTAVYKTMQYDQLVEDCNFTGPMTPEIVLQLAQMIRKVENQKITLARLIEKRERLDKEILEKNEGKGITDKDKLIASYSLHELAQFLHDEKFDSDSDTFVELETTDEEDMPRSRNVVDKEGFTDIEIEKPISYISRLRKAALKGNVGLVAKFNTLERKIEQLGKVQEEIHNTYERRIKPIQKEFTAQLSKIQTDLVVAKREREEIKTIVSTGFKKTPSGQLISVEAEIDKVEKAHQETLKKLSILEKQYSEANKELERFKTEGNPEAGDSNKRLRELTLENKRLNLQLKKKPEKEEDTVSKKEYDQICKVKEEAEERLIQLETESEFALEDVERYKQVAKSASERAAEKTDEAEKVAMAAQNRLNALVAQHDEELQTIKNQLIEPLIQKNSTFGLMVMNLQEERNQAEKAKSNAEIKLKDIEDTTMDMIKKAELKGYMDAKKKFIKEVGTCSTQTEITMAPKKRSLDDILDSSSIRFLKEIGGFADHIEERGDFVTYEDYVKKYHYNKDGDPPTKEEREELKSEYEGYVHGYYYKKEPPLATEEDLLKYRTERISKLVSALQRRHDEMGKQKHALQETQELLQSEQERYVRNEQRTPKLVMNFSELAERLSKLEEKKYKSPVKFFSYPIKEWEEKFKQAFGFSKFTCLDIHSLNLEESKDLFTLLTEINKHTGSKSHIWYGNELNRKFNHRDSTQRPKDKAGLLRRAQDTFLEWLNADATLGFTDLEADLVTRNSISYAKLLNAIGNTSVRRSIFIDNI